jgi:hypothetical protein
MESFAGEDYHAELNWSKEWGGVKGRSGDSEKKLKNANF